MDLTVIVADATAALALAQLAISVGKSATPFITTAYNVLVNKTALTDQQRADMLTQETALRAELNTPSIPADKS